MLISARLRASCGAVSVSVFQACIGFVAFPGKTRPIGRVEIAVVAVIFRALGACSLAWDMSRVAKKLFSAADLPAQQDPDGQFWRAGLR